VSRMGLLVLVFVVGCQCAVPHESDPPESGETAETGETGNLDPILLRVEPSLPEDTLPPEGATLSMVRVRFGEGPAIGETISSVPLELAGTSIPIPVVAPTEHAVELSPHLGIHGALYMLIAYDDLDGDGAYSEGERVLGVAMDRWVLLLHALEQEHELSVVNSWRVVDLGIAGQYEPNRCALDSSWPMEWMLDDGYPVYHELDEPIPLPLRGLEASATLGGDIAGLERDDLRLAALPYPHLGHREVTPWLEQSLSRGQASFSGQLAGEPPEEDDVGSDPDWRYTMHLLLPYIDSDGSGGFTTGDDPEGASTCLGGELAWARYTRAVHSYRGFRFLDCYAGTVGWRPAHYADHGGIEYLSSEQGAQLALDFTGCRLD
jgi:hypothetical protein